MKNPLARPAPLLDPVAVAPWSAPADPARTDGRRVGVLLLHGFTGSPASMRPWAESLAARGIGVRVPLLPGHGTRWTDLNAATWDDWVRHALAEFDALAAEVDAVVVAGLSMGGALTLRVGIERPDAVSGLVLVNPGIATRRRDIHLLPVLKHVIPALDAIGNDIRKPGVDEFGYPVTPLRAADSMFKGWAELRKELSRVVAPTLMFRSRVDHVVDELSSQVLHARIGSSDFTERILEESYHVATLDHDAGRIEVESAEFVHRVTRPQG